MLLLGRCTCGRGIGLGTVLLAGLEAKNSAELIEVGAFVVVVVEEAEEAELATPAGLAMSE